MSNDLDPSSAGITPALFQEWRSPRFGDANPSCMNNPVWEWLIRERINAYQANRALEGPSSCAVGPCWCFDRFGQSTTHLVDGRQILIAGEHEDSYDPDFCIYNDVVVLHPDQHIDIYGYPAENFPPTDFHSATLVARQIILIGNLGYRGQRHIGTTQVLMLHLDDFRISPIQTQGTAPGWIHDHQAQLAEDAQSITIRGGKIDRGDDQSLIENIDEWRLHLGDWRWERLTEHQWPRWEMQRRDQRRNHLWELRQALWARGVGWQDQLEQAMNELTGKLGAEPDLDLLAALYQPPLEYTAIPSDDPEEHNIFRIRVQGVVVRFVEKSDTLQVTVEGELPTQIIESLQSELLRKLQTLENTVWITLPI